MQPESWDDLNHSLNFQISSVKKAYFLWYYTLIHWHLLLIHFLELPFN